MSDDHGIRGILVSLYDEAYDEGKEQGKRTQGYVSSGFNARRNGSVDRALEALSRGLSAATGAGTGAGAGTGPLAVASRVPAGAGAGTGPLAVASRVPAGAPSEPEPEVLLGLQFHYADGYVVQWTPGGARGMVNGTVRFDLSGPKDEFGVPPHVHEPLQIQPLGDRDGLDLAMEAAKHHGPPQAMVPSLVRKVGRYTAILYGVPERYGQSGCMVMALAPREGEDPLTEDQVREKISAGGTLELPEHDHWFAADRPLPVPAALWIFRSLTEENILATNCNCAPRRPRGAVPVAMPLPPEGLYAGPVSVESPEDLDGREDA